MFAGSRTRGLSAVRQRSNRTLTASENVSGRKTGEAPWRPSGSAAFAASRRSFIAARVCRRGAGIDLERSISAFTARKIGRRGGIRTRMGSRPRVSETRVSACCTTRREFGRGGWVCTSVGRRPARLQRAAVGCLATPRRKWCGRRDLHPQRAFAHRHLGPARLLISPHPRKIWPGGAESHRSPRGHNAMLWLLSYAPGKKATARRETLNTVSAFASSVAGGRWKMVEAAGLAPASSRSQAECLKLLGYASKTGCGCRGRTDLAWAYETRRNDWFYPQWETGTSGWSRHQPARIGSRVTLRSSDVKIALRLRSLGAGRLLRRPPSVTAGREAPSDNLTSSAAQIRKWENGPARPASPFRVTKTRTARGC